MSYPPSGHGEWSHDDVGLPCFEATFAAPGCVERPFIHSLSTGRMSAHVNRRGLVHLFTTENGYTDLTAAHWRTRSGCYLAIEIAGERRYLVFADLAEHRSVRYGTGYAAFAGGWQGENGEQLAVTQEFYMPPDRSTRLGASFKLHNESTVPLATRLVLRSDVEPNNVQEIKPRGLATGAGFSRWLDFHPGLGDFELRADDTWSGFAEPGTGLFIERPLELAPGETFSFVAQVGYAAPFAPLPDPETSRRAWARRLSTLQFPDMERDDVDEAVWSAGQLLTFEALDTSVNEHYLNLGGYGWRAFGAREVPETAMACVTWAPELALTCLRWTAKLQQADGNIRHRHDFVRRGPNDAPLRGHEESDNEIWFLMACAKVVGETGRTDLFDEDLPFWEGEVATVWEHLRRAVRWVMNDGIGTGRHGLVRIAEGDWNDYLSCVGRGGHGESMMNTGMMCTALRLLQPFAESRDPSFARECALSLENLRAAAAAGFDQQWFVRGFDDDGKAFGTMAEKRLFLNAQSWCVLGECGTREQRESAMRSALEHCHSPLGLMLMSRPYSCPAPRSIATALIPPGDGENSGIWPQTVHWAIWALCELGWRDEALAVWRRVSLRNHAGLYPDVPYGIFNGPDCFSSHFAGPREGWSQIDSQVRSRVPPMNPMVAWQAFGLEHIRRLS